MDEMGTRLTVLGSAIASKDMIFKLLGPTADYIGNEVKNWTEKRIQNVASIFKNAEKKVDLDRPGQVPPKVIKEILDDGSFADNDILIEYYGGVLASSRTEERTDDRGATFLKMLGQLSTYQIKMHYISYQLIRNQFIGRNLLFTKNGDDGRDGMRIFLPMSEYYRYYGDETVDKLTLLLQHIFFGLKRFNVIQDFTYSSNNLKYNEQGDKMPGIRILPSAYGAELFNWVYGYCDLSTKEILNPNRAYKEFKDIKLAHDKVIQFPKTIDRV